MIGWKRRAKAFLAEPTLHFLVLGGLVFLVNRLFADDPQVIVVDADVKADLSRRFLEHNGRLPNPSELEGEVKEWAKGEALYREALHDRLDRDDATIRAALADRVRARVALTVPRQNPSQDDLDRWLAAHRTLYEAPVRYDYQYMIFPAASSSPGQLEGFEQALQRGADPSALGRPVVGGNLTAEELFQRLGPRLGARVQSLPMGQWQRLENEDSPMLARLNAIEGGLPSAEILRARLVADWSFAQQQHDVDQAVQAIVDRYRLEERP